MTARIEQIVNKFPQLTGREELIADIIEIREAFGLERVPFRVRTPDFDSGALDSFYGAERRRLNEARTAKKRAAKRRRY